MWARLSSEPPGQIVEENDFGFRVEGGEGRIGATKG